MKGEQSLIHVAAVSTYHHFKVTRFAHKIQIVVVELQHIGRYLKRYLSRFTGFQEDFLKAFQFFHRTGYTAHKVADVKLHHFGTITLSGIGHR